MDTAKNITIEDTKKIQTLIGTSVIKNRQKTFGHIFYYKRSVR